ncbi:alpha,alpha-trehalase TreF [Caulobacter segnis]|nr:alpha,alpha-trehalase TreF [Caulobacter segnis]MDG2521980.1 alpha,alpha-trehalase TreF [Caulobacter segnis]
MRSASVQSEVCLLRHMVIAAAATALSLGTAHAQVATPADLYSELFHQVQMRRLFPDGKTFVDATARRSPDQILASYRARTWFSDEELKRFVATQFDLPQEVLVPTPSTARPPIDTHIARLWPILTRQPAATPEGSTALRMDNPYVVPGGRFREMYYWDSYFTMLGLAEDDRQDLIEAMVDDFGSLIDRYGRIPNGTRSYYLSRSQPPFFYLMVDLTDQSDALVLRRRLDQMRREYAFWMQGEESLSKEGAFARVVRMPDGAVLNRYWDDRNTPRDESWREDILTAREGKRPAADIFRDLRAGAESGWDFSARWLADGKSLHTIQTTAFVPVDLNSLMYGMERAIADACRRLDDHTCGKDFDRRADARRAAMDRWLWNAEQGLYLDYQWRERRASQVVSSAALYPLFVGAASQRQANIIARKTWDELLAPGGLRTTTLTTGQQWDAPNGWAPLQWVAVKGLRTYGEDALAAEIGKRWLATVQREYQASGRMLEKYDIEEVRPGGGGEYPLQDGFGWTNGVTQALLALYPAS